MKKIKRYIVMGLIGSLLISCGTDLEPEMIPVRTIEDMLTFVLPEGDSRFERIFVSDEDLYITHLYNGVEAVYAYNLQNGERREVSLVVEGDDDGYFSQRLVQLLYDVQSQGSSRLGGSCWALGKGYIIGDELTFIYSPETDTWTYVANNGLTDLSFSGGSNMVLQGKNLVQISSKKIYFYSLTSHRWSSIPITHDFTYYNGNAELFCVKDKLYACNTGLFNGLYVYDANTNLWNEVKMEVEGYLDHFSVNKVLITDDTICYICDNSGGFMMLECDLNGGKVSSFIDGSALNVSLQSYFNVGYICIAYAYDNYDGSFNIIKFNLK